MPNVKRKQILKILARDRHVTASQLIGPLNIDRDEAIERLRGLMDESAVERTTVNDIQVYTLTRAWKEKMK